MTISDVRPGRTPDPGFAEALSERSRCDLLNALSKKRRPSQDLNRALRSAIGSVDDHAVPTGFDAVVSRVVSLFRPFGHVARHDDAADSPTADPNTADPNTGNLGTLRGRGCD